MKKKIFLIFTAILMCTSFMQNVFAANETNEVYSTKVIKCGSVRGIPAGLPKMCRNAINTIKILVPVILIVMGIIDMLKATTANDEKIMKDAQTKFIRRIVAAVLVFFVVAIVQFVINLIGRAAFKQKNLNVSNTKNDISLCVGCFVSNSKYCVSDDKYLDE